MVGRCDFFHAASNGICQRHRIRLMVPDSYSRWTYLRNERGAITCNTKMYVITNPNHTSKAGGKARGEGKETGEGREGRGEGEPLRPSSPASCDKPSGLSYLVWPWRREREHLPLPSPPHPLTLLAHSYSRPALLPRCFFKRGVATYHTRCHAIRLCTIQSCAARAPACIA